MPARLSLVPLLLALFVAMLGAGCGDDDGGEETVTVTEPAPAETTAGEQTAAEPTDTGTAGAGTITAADLPAGDRGPTQFQTPSKNIGCYIDASGVRCDISGRSWQPPAPTEPCELDYGQGISLDASGAAFVCAGDTVLGGPATLPYGDAARRGDFGCLSSEAGISCLDTASGHGFSLSRESYEIF